jgi:hypothetical protein
VSHGVISLRRPICKPREAVTFREMRQRRRVSSSAIRQLHQDASKSYAGWRDAEWACCAALHFWVSSTLKLTQVQMSGPDPIILAGGVVEAQS